MWSKISKLVFVLYDLAKYIKSDDLSEFNLVTNSFRFFSSWIITRWSNLSYLRKSVNFAQDNVCIGTLLIYGVIFLINLSTIFRYFTLFVIEPNKYKSSVILDAELVYGLSYKDLGLINKSLTSMLLSYKNADSESQ